jgi:hypothetical protein
VHEKGSVLIRHSASASVAHLWLAIDSSRSQCSASAGHATEVAKRVMQKPVCHASKHIQARGSSLGIFVGGGLYTSHEMAVPKLLFNHIPSATHDASRGAPRI